MTRVRSRAVGALLAVVATLLPVPAIATTTGSPYAILYPYVECVSAPLSGSLWGATFGYVNTGEITRFVTRGFNNGFAPEPEIRPGQLTAFLAGVHPAAYSTYFDPEAYVSWSLFGVVDVATTSSTRCEQEVAAPVVAGTLSPGKRVVMAGERVLLPYHAYDVTYRWFRDCDTADPVHVGDGRDYQVQAADVGHRLQATITYARTFTATSGEESVVGLRTSSACGPAAEVAAGPAATVTPASLGFPATIVGDAAQLSASYVNTTSLAVSLGGVTIGGPDAADFTVVDSPCAESGGDPLQPGATCEITVRFAPTTGGAKTATLLVDDGPLTREVPIHAVAGAPPAILVPPVLSGTPGIGRPVSVTEGQWSGDPTVTIAWEACTAVACGRVGAGPTFTPGADEVGASVRAVVTATNRFGTDRVVTVAVGPVPGPPAPPTPPPAAAVLSLSSPRVDLGKAPVRKPGKARTLTIANTGGSPLVVQSVAVTGKHRKDVVLATTCPGDTLSPGASCTVTLRLRPAAAGRRTASMVVTSNAPGGARSVVLVGKGVRRER